MTFYWTRFFVTVVVEDVDEIGSRGVEAKIDEKSMFGESNFWELFNRFAPIIRFVWMVISAMLFLVSSEIVGNF